ncbi:hypothetical protein PIN31009_03943 [Pandoraea iniqua]|uniref:Uncharacterized protein n=1 Tax=Pandoraea iniqua TaxID=2508288 RepID=A0A5E4Y3N9_9BURK|nr:hypothetical protein [Pandoraea iniqua]VVE37418.1 hypothetical protein PIN31009_03943 [Pandoraea iniqua]VVE43291.1 hypothetical protein PIN31115_04245 [Pandoraea iniqua]
MKRKFVGECSLTGEHGQLVKSHLIPRALTRLSLAGEKHIQFAIGGRGQRVPDSWYDLKLVTQKGEDILSDIDSRGIEELRAHHLVWSGWGGRAVLCSVLELEAGAPFRMLRLSDTSTLRLFFLSLLWRAGASELDAMTYVQLTTAELEDLRKRVLSCDPGSVANFPVVLHQLSTLGPPHNRVPLLEEEPLFGLDGQATGEVVSYVRFYFEGLVARIYLGSRQPLPDWIEQIALRDDGNALISLRPFDDSRTKDDINSLMAAYDRWTRQCDGTRG